MKKLLILFMLFGLLQTVVAQQALEVISQVKNAQSKLHTVSYTLERTDTLVTGDIRSMTGTVKMKVSENDSIFGCWFWAKRDGFNEESIYDGNTGFVIDHEKKEYKMTSKKEGLVHFLYSNAGGQVVFTELIKMDTSKNTGFTIAQDHQYYYLTKHIPDLKEYDVYNRYTIYTIDKKLLLPVGMRSHQETLGKVQDLNYRVKEIWVDDPTHSYDFAAQRLPAGYRSEAEQEARKATVSALINKPLPSFRLVSIKGDEVASAQLKGKVVLLDFLEVWCGPCFESAPKVQALYAKYKNAGLQVYGISFEKAQVSSMKKLVDKFRLEFPVLIGNEEIRKSYEVEAIPRYIIIDRKGYVSFARIGFSDELEKEIINKLRE